LLLIGIQGDSYRLPRSKFSALKQYATRKMLYRRTEG
jgi:hypothetical protein